MTTETDLRSALLTRAADAPVLDPDRLLAELTHRTPPVRSVSGVSHGRRWAVAGVAAGVVALAAVPVAVVAHDDAGRGGTVAPGGVTTSTPPLASHGATADPSASAQAAARAAASRAAAQAAADAASRAAAAASGLPSDNPYDPAAPAPLAADWTNTDDLGSVPYDPSAVVFSADPIVGSYVRPHQQLSILPAGATAKDSSDAQWHTAVQVYLAGSGFDPASLGDPTAVTVNGVARQFGTLPRLLDVPGPAVVPSLLWQVGDAWVVLQVDRPVVPTLEQLSTAAAEIDVHPGQQ